MSASTATAPLEGEDLKAAWMDLKEGKGFLPLKIGADALGVPEAVLQNVLQSSGVVRLKNDIVGILKSAPPHSMSSMLFQKARQNPFPMNFKC